MTMLVVVQCAKDGTDRELTRCELRSGAVPTALPDSVVLHRSTKVPTADAGTAERRSDAEVSAGARRFAASGRFEDHIRQDSVLTGAVASGAG